MNKRSGRGGKWRQGTIFRARVLDVDGTLNLFETDQVETDTPTQQFTTVDPANLQQGIILRIHYLLNPTAAETYRLNLYENAYADNMTNRLRRFYRSDDLRADLLHYDIEVEIPIKLEYAGRLYYQTEWTGAPGNTLGFCEISGVVHY